MGLVEPMSQEVPQAPQTDKAPSRHRASGTHLSIHSAPQELARCWSDTFSEWVEVLGNGLSTLLAWAALATRVASYAFSGFCNRNEQDSARKQLRVTPHASPPYLRTQHLRNAAFLMVALWVPRDDAENTTFKFSLPCLNRFSSHPHVIVWKVSPLPEGYPQSRPYEIPEGYSPVEYSGRSWCYAEAAMAGLGKSPKFVCNVCQLSPGEHVVGGSVVFPAPPLTPEKFNVELGAKTFTQPAADVARVQNLHRSAFSERAQSGKFLKYANLAWGPAQVTVFAEAKLENTTVEEIDLSMNEFGAQGMKSLRQVLCTRTLKILRVGNCALGLDATLEIVEASGREHCVNLRF